MFRKFFLALVCLAAGAALSAQTPVQTAGAKSDGPSVTTYSFGTNWFVGVGGGLSLYIGDHDGNGGIGERLAPAYGLSFGKWLSPHFGIRLDVAGHNMKGLTQNNKAEGYTTGEAAKGEWGYWLYKQKFSFVNAQVDLLFNLRTIFLGNKPDQLWDPVPYIGVGFANVFTKPGGNSLSCNAGFLNFFNIGNALAITLDLKAMMAMDKFDGEVGGRSFDGMGSLAVGVAYKF